MVPLKLVREYNTPGGYSLSSGLQLADLKPDQQVVLADTLTQVGFGDGVQLGGWNWHTQTEAQCYQAGICLNFREDE